MMLGIYVFQKPQVNVIASDESPVMVVITSYNGLMIVVSYVVQRSLNGCYYVVYSSYDSW